MSQYESMLQAILEYGTQKPAARANMPGSLSLYGFQNVWDLSKGFPAISTKKLFFGMVKTELEWFLRSDDNIKFMVDRGCNIWNQDAYSYYLKIMKREGLYEVNLENFVDAVKKGHNVEFMESVHGGIPENYQMGDTGYQYPVVWRQWQKQYPIDRFTIEMVDQISDVIDGLRNQPEGRRHIVTATDPAHDDDLALYWCHNMFQFNCRPISADARLDIALDLIDSEEKKNTLQDALEGSDRSHLIHFLDLLGVPKYHLDCKLYQRSADAFLGVPFNIASYALLTHIFAKMCNMVPGHFIHSFGDLHIYDNHMEPVKELLSREPYPMPQLVIETDKDWTTMTIDEVVDDLQGVKLVNYLHHPPIKGELSTGL